MGRDLNVDQVKKLWVLDLVIRSGSLKKAALAAKVSPSAVSQTLTSLEQSAGKRLLMRERGVIQPTAEALQILRIVRPAFEAFEKLRSLNQLEAPKISWLAFGTYESMAIDILPGLVAKLKQKMPHLRLSLRISRTSSLLSMVRKGELCSALVAEADSLGRFYCKEAGVDRLGLFVARNHSIAKLGWHAIEEHGLGSLAPGKEGHARYFVKFIKQLNTVKPFLLSDSFEVLRAAAAAGSLAAVLPARVASRADDLVEIHPPRPFYHSGKHKLLVVSQMSCDRAETDFIAAEAAEFLN